MKVYNMAVKLTRQHENTTTVALRLTKRQKADIKRGKREGASPLSSVGSANLTHPR